MTQHPEKPIAPLPDAAGTPPANPDAHKFGDAATQDGKEQAAEDDAAEQLGNFA
ncbi:hypothetical protein [Sphingomonas crusticola]|uniref:hypothetical protein n=1 Tax=Sphingomonas crusticola TaxID=1697973 RepID=UPI0013C3051E|nr:hypothetical protein [Sphingomonas crusticola]